MNSRLFALLVLSLALAALVILHHQRTELKTARSTLRIRDAGLSPQVGEPLLADDASGSGRPSAELLRLRNEVTLLHHEEKAARAQLSREQMAADWAFVHSGPKPSEQPGFAYFTQVTNAGFATPATAFQSFNFFMRNQQKEPMTDAHMAELWAVPDDFADPNARYSIDIGEGMGNEVGYRIVKEESIATNEVRLTLEYQRPDDSSYRRDKVMVEHNGLWRVQPVRVSRGGAGL
jgi:hypothetical protein